MTATQFDIAVTCAIGIISLMITILVLMFKIASGWSKGMTELGNLKDDIKVLVDNKIIERLSKVEWMLEDLHAVRNQERRGRLPGNQQGYRGNKS